MSSAFALLPPELRGDLLTPGCLRPSDSLRARRVLALPASPAASLAGHLLQCFSHTDLLQFLRHAPRALSFISRPLSMLCPLPGVLFVLLFGQVLLAVQASAQMSLHRSLLRTHRPLVFPSHMERTDPVLLPVSSYCGHTPTPFFKCEKYQLEGMCSVGAVPYFHPAATPLSGPIPERGHCTLEMPWGTTTYHQRRGHWWRCRCVQGVHCSDHHACSIPWVLGWNYHMGLRSGIVNFSYPPAILELQRPGPAYSPHPPLSGTTPA